MNGNPQVIIARLKASRLKLSAIARESGLNAATIWRLKNDLHDPRLSTLQRVEDAIERLEGASEAA